MTGVQTCALPILLNWLTSIANKLASMSPFIDAFGLKLDAIFARTDLTFSAKLDVAWDNFDELLINLGASRDTAEGVKNKLEAIGEGAQSG